jgi:gamma-glutamylcyclotransferase (GGCT)/AIG2-like uncharacterized protein YtfP
LSDRLFVYGTLRPGAAMHRLLEDRVTVLGPASVAGRLVDLGAFPGLVAPASFDDRVRGDLCEIPDAERDALLDVLDRYEGESFERLRAAVDAPDGVVEAWLYRWRGDPTGRRLVPSGDYLAATERNP